MPEGLTDVAARTLLRAQGLRCTGVRIAVLQALSAADGHLSVADLHARAGADVSTVYRTVTTLQELGLLHSVALADQPVSYGLAHQAHHHAVCTRCHRLTEVPAPAVAEAVSIFAGATGFVLDGVGALELHGLCAKCRDAATMS